MAIKEKKKIENKTHKKKIDYKKDNTKSNNKQTKTATIQSQKQESSLQQKSKLKEKRKNKNKEDEDQEQYEIVEKFDGGYFNTSANYEISNQDEELLQRFMNNDNQMINLGDIISKQIDKQFQEKKNKEIEEDILNDPRVKTVYNDVAKLMKEYTSGQLCKAMNAIPQLDQWDRVLDITRPSEWSAQAMNTATKMMASNMDQYRSRQFFEKYLLPAVRSDIQQNKKLNYHYYWALKKAFYKPAAWFKGILFPLCKNSSIKEAQIIASILSKLSIPVVHSSVALLKLSEMEFTGATCMFMKVLLEKKYALPIRVLISVCNFFLRYQNDKREMPVIWHQILLRFCQLYSNALEDSQKNQLKKLVQVRNHTLISPEIIKVLEQLPTNLIIEKNLQKSMAMNIE